MTVHHEPEITPDPDLISALRLYTSELAKIDPLTNLPVRRAAPSDDYLRGYREGFAAGSQDRYAEGYDQGRRDHMKGTMHDDH